MNLDSTNSGSNYQFNEKLELPNNPRSLFDLSHLNTMTIPKTGALIPIACIETLPTDSMDISVKALLRVLPQVVPLYSKQTINIHGFYSRMGELWRGFNTFMSKGYTGKVVKQIPTITDTNTDMTNDKEVSNDSLFNYLYDLPIGIKLNKVDEKITALKNMMYLRIWRDYFMNKDYFVNDRVLLPDDDDDFRLNDDGDIISDTNHTIKFNEILYRDWADDYFTTAKPFPQRGEEATLNLHIRDIDQTTGDAKIYLDVNYADDGVYDTGLKMYMYKDHHGGMGIGMKNKNGDGYKLDVTENESGTAWTPKVYDDFEIQETGEFNGGVSLENLRTNISLNEIRQLAIQQTELEKMAKTDGSYSQFGLTFFGKSSKTAQTFKPTYIGGTTQKIQFTEVLQTSATTISEGGEVQNALGQYGGHGISGTNDDGYIGHIECDDYGYIMILASITPDIYYSQGMSKSNTRLLQSEFYLPERAKLGMTAILNKELMFQGNTADDNVWAYQDIFEEFRYEQNKIHGKLADSSEESFFPYTQSRHFENLPTYSASFATTKGTVRNDYLVAPTEVPYTAQFAINIRAVRPLPYRATPAKVI